MEPDGETTAPLTSRRRYAALVPAIPLLLLLGLASLPPPLVDPLSAGPHAPALAWVDRSWIHAQSLAASQGLLWGSQLVWTHGPLGFLGYPVLTDYWRWAAAVIVGLVVHMGLILATGALLVRNGTHPALWLVAALALVLPSAQLVLELQLMLLAILLLPEADGRGSAGLFFIAAAMALLALAAMVKATALGAGSGIVLAYAGLAVVRGRRTQAALALVAAPVCAVALWLVAGQALSDLAPFARSALELASGYPEGMVRTGLLPTGIIAVFLVIEVLGSVAWCAGLGLAWKRAPGRLVTHLVVAAPLLFVEFRNSVVRPTRGALLELGGFLIVLGVLTAARMGPGRTVGTRRFNVPRAAAIAWGLVLVAAIGDLAIERATTVGGVPERLGAYATAARMFTTPSERSAEYARTALAARASYSLDPALVDHLRPGTVDVVPWDIGVIPAYGLRWSPSPVLQTYSAYTPWLDGRDAAFFRSGVAQHVLYVDESIDDRYPPADEPAAFHELIRNYTPAATSGPYVALDRRAAYLAASTRDEGTACASAGNPVNVPARPGRWVFGSLKFALSPAGRLLNMALEPPEPRLRLTSGGGHVTHEHRLVPGTAPDGILLSAYASSGTSLGRMMSGIFDDPITAVAATSRGALAYDQRFCVDFHSEPTPPGGG